jgi:sulfoxide reductase heme-binding subunit YedZ
MVSKILSSKWTKVVLFVASGIPFGYLLWLVGLQWRAAMAGDVAAIYLTADPIKYITHFTGDWTIRFLLITLAVTPLRTIFKRPQLTRFRRMLGLFAFFYCSLHFLTWSVLDKELDLSALWADILKRWFITVGMVGFFGMIPLAVTSTGGWVRRMGYKRWQKLHRLVYVCATAGVIHYYLLVKSDVREPLMYGAILAVLLGYRVYAQRRQKRPIVKRAPAAAVRES